MTKSKVSLIVFYSLLLGYYSEGRSWASAPYGWRFVPSAWRYYGNSGGGILENGELAPSTLSYRSSRKAEITGGSILKRDTNFWNYGSCDLTCDGGTCVKQEFLCDGYTQCWDGTDEKGCTCASFIGDDKLCDGYRDCPDGGDEEGCVYGCNKQSEFTCDTYNSGSKARCIPLSKRCDGYTDCVNGNDEMDCYRMINLKEETRGIRSHGVLQKRMENEWYTLCKTSTSARYINTYAEKACKHISGYSDGTVKVNPTSLNNIKSQLSKQQLQDLKYVRVGETEAKFSVLGACTTDTIYEVSCPTPQCGGMGNREYQRRRRDIEEDDEELLFEEEEELGEMIVGGYNTKELSWPFLVGIFRDGEFYCGGSIINERWILTAAHCNHGYEKHTFEVQAGMQRRFSWSPYEQTRHVEEIYVHESYEPSIFANDIALYKLDKPLHFSKYVTPACFPSGKEDDPKAGQKCKVAGWGDLHESGAGPDHMQEVALPVLERCHETFTRDAYQICAGVLEGGKDACQGDSGGPLMCMTQDGRPVVSGLVSFGRGCAREDEAGAYTRISAYLDWIDNVMNGGYSSYHLKPKQCSEKCHKPGGECLYADEKCSGKIDCLGGEDEVGCGNFISRSYGWNSNQRPPPFFNFGMSRATTKDEAVDSQQSPQLSERAKGRSSPSSRNGYSGTKIRRTSGSCTDEEVQCATLERSGLKECISETDVCDLEPTCSDKSDEINCIALTNDFEELMDFDSDIKPYGEMKGYVIARYQDSHWHPILLSEWTLDIGQVVCNAVSPSSKAALKSLETIELKVLAHRLRSHVNLMESSVIKADYGENVLALASHGNLHNKRAGKGLSIFSYKEMRSNGYDDGLMLGFVRCQVL